VWTSREFQTVGVATQNALDANAIVAGACCNSRADWWHHKLLQWVDEQPTAKCFWCVLALKLQLFTTWIQNSKISETFRKWSVTSGTYSLQSAWRDKSQKEREFYIESGRLVISVYVARGQAGFSIALWVFFQTTNHCIKSPKTLKGWGKTFIIMFSCFNLVWNDRQTDWKNIEKKPLHHKLSLCSLAAIFLGRPGLATRRSPFWIYWS